MLWKMKIPGLTFRQLFAFFIAISSANPTQFIPCNDTKQWVFTCDDGNCISNRHVCNGKVDCPDGSDEKEYNTFLSSDDWRACTKLGSSATEKKCALPKSLVCDNYRHCREDECDCYYRSFSCSSEECIPFFSYCDGIKDCTNGQDEKPYESSYAEGVKCRSIEISTYVSIKHACILPHKSPERCDGSEDCLSGSDECFCNVDKFNHSYFNEEVFFDSKCFRCLDTIGETLQQFVCDGYIHCSDLSDECLCENPIATCKQLVHNTGDCQFLCKKYPGGNFTGSSNETKCIKKTQICDGERDCFYGEDEKYCPSVWYSKYLTKKIKHEESKEFWCCNAGYPADCLDENTYTNDSYDACDQFHKCSKPTRYQNYQTYAFQCDGIASCENMGDECNEDCNTVTRPQKCQDTELEIYTCPNDQGKLRPWLVCDGRADCNPSEPAKSADEFDCAKRFYCRNIANSTQVSVEPSKKCNCVNDCVDGSDEVDCTDYSPMFCCEAGNEAVRNSTVCDGKDDCSDGSDECQSCIKSPFADDKHLISNKVLRAFIWIIGLVSSGGNVYVIWNTIKRYRRSRNKVAKVNSIQVLSLAFADLCVGIYLLGLGIANALFSDVYCHKDESWRSGQVCKSFGVLTTFGLQASVFLMTFISINRLYSIKSNILETQKTRHSFFIIPTLYITALIVAIVPVLPMTEEYFLTSVRFAENPFLKRAINRTQLNKFAVQLSHHGKDGKFHDLLGNPLDSSYQWHQVFHAMFHLNDTFVPRYKFGYYSTHGVCLPKFFPKRSSDNWTRRYSLLLISVNFLSFFIIFLCYILIYRETKRIEKSAGRRIEQTILEKRISRIILTDFCCWMPICLTGFLASGGVIVSNDFYAITAIIIVPINSALNPFLYSNLPDRISERAVTIYSSIKLLQANRLTDSQNSTVEMNAL